ncbi:MAG: hypothetical protein KIT83_16310, partial [Bryobacterales bacterium]|nr:hypothetical protein [Bryobacterales bacterium]
LNLETQLRAGQLLLEYQRGISRQRTNPFAYTSCPIADPAEAIAQPAPSLAHLNVASATESA